MLYQRSFIRAVIIFLFMGLVVLSGCGRTGLYERTELMMGTVIKISVADRDKTSSRINRAVEKAFSRMREVNKSMSAYNSNSELNRINESGPGRMVRVSDELLEVVRKSVEISNISSGAFDITAGPLVELWGFGLSDGAKEAPSSKQIEAVFSLVNYRNIIVDEQDKKIGLGKPGMRIDLGGIAKGYAVDKAIEALKEEGIENAIVDAGGDLYCLGTGFDQTPWVIGAKDPRRPGKVIARFKLRDRACATSGDYENFFIIDGERFSHLIDPRTGRPVQNGLVSVTVLAPTCLEADSLATAIFVLGKKEGLELINNLDKTEAIIVSRQGNAALAVAFSQGYFRKGNDFMLQPGDLLFQDLDCGPFCDAIEKVTTGYQGTSLSHIGIVAKDSNDNFIVIEALPAGVNVTPLEVFLKRSLDARHRPKVAVGRLKQEYRHLIPVALKEAFVLEGSPYDEVFDCNNDSYYCSELVYEIFLRSNNDKPIFELQPMTFKDPDKGDVFSVWREYFLELNVPIPEGEPGINPGAISRSPALSVIYEYGSLTKANQ